MSNMSSILLGRFPGLESDVPAAGGVAARYKSAIAERDSVQMRLMYLRQIDQGQADPILRGEIEVSQSRVEKLNYKIKEMEEKWV